MDTQSALIEQLNSKIALLEQEKESIKHRLKEANEYLEVAEKQFLQIKNNFSAFFDLVDEFIFVLDEQGHIVFANTTVYNRLEYNEVELIGKSVLSLHPINRRDEAAVIFSEMLAGKTYYCPVSLVTKSGVEIPVETKVNRGFWDENPVIFGLSKDVSKNKFTEEKFTKLFYLNPSGCAITDYSTHCYLEVNEAFLELFGFSKNEIIGKTPEELGIFDFDTRKRLLEFADCTEKISNVEVGLSSKDGTFKRVILSAEVFFVGNKMYRYTVIQDITELKKTAEELRKAKEIAELSERKFRAIADTAPLAIYISTGLEQNAEYINPTFERLFGYSFEEVSCVAKWWVLAYPSPDYQNQVSSEWQAKVAIAMQNKSEIEPMETIVTCKDGLTKIIIWGFISTGLENWAFGLDVTERKKAEKELIAAKERAEESEERFKALHNASFGGITIHDKGLIIDCNKGLSEITGYSFDELIGMDGLLLIAPHKRDLVFSNIVSGYDKAYEAVGLRKNGEEYPIRLEGRNIPYKGRMVRVVEFRDITEQKNAELEILKAKERAEESDMLKTAFLQNMSHEIRTPLNAICGFTDLLNNPDVTAEKRERFISIIQNSSNQLLSIVSDILTISSLETKQETINIEPVCINDLMINLQTIFKQQAANRGLMLDVNLGLSRELSFAKTDKTKLTQILTNLLSNSMKFTHKGYIQFGYDVVEKNGLSSLQFYVKDTGIGIQAEMHEKIFDRFRQADLSISKNYGGTGLGLSISKGLVTLLGGQIWVQSTQGEGSVFYFSVPYNPVCTVVAGIEVPEVRKDHKTVLVAEDGEYNFVYIEELLLDLNYTVVRAENGRQAVELFKSNKEISLILMDIKMPIMDGHTAAKQIKQISPHMRIIAQSAYALDKEIEMYSDVFDDYITKPINKNELIKKLK